MSLLLRKSLDTLHMVAQDCRATASQLQVMGEEKPKSGKKKKTECNQRVEIYPTIVKLIQQNLPEHKRRQRLTPIVNDLLYEALENGLDSTIKLGRPSPSGALEGAGLTSINNIRNKEKENSEFSTSNLAFIKDQKNKPQQDPIAFTEFWQTYNTAINKANQSKKLAREEWPKAAKKVENVQDLILAAQKAVKDQRIQMEVKGECTMLPDAFRWLRDERWEPLLEPPVVDSYQYQSVPEIL